MRDRDFVIEKQTYKETLRRVPQDEPPPNFASEAPLSITVPGPGGAQYIIERPEGDPYGFWRIRITQGKIPEQLSGVYTSAARAQQALEVYLRQK